MNIANIFGLHLGCKVKFSTGEIAILSGVDSDHIHINNTLRHYQIKDCKLLLKPLSAISEEDKAEFQNIMMCGFKFEKVYLYDINKGHPNYKKQWIIIAKTIVGTELFVNSPDQILWLASKGYDVGIVPDEYKEIYHGK